MSFLDEKEVASASVVAQTPVEVYSISETFASIQFDDSASAAKKSLVGVVRFRSLMVRIRVA